jgi:5'-deoxynucleotidase
MPGISHFFAYMARMKFIRRWGIMRNTSVENIQEHSLQTAMIAHALALIGNRLYGSQVDPQRVIALAVYHEAAEVITGDLPTPIKYFNEDIKNAYHEIEDIASRRLYDMIPAVLQADFRPLLFAEEDDREHHLIVKAADKICAYMKCQEEEKAGNQEFSKAKRVIEDELSRLDRPEVSYFMATFAPSFSLTLDELN